MSVHILTDGQSPKGVDVILAKCCCSLRFLVRFAGERQFLRNGCWEHNALIRFKSTAPNALTLSPHGTMVSDLTTCRMGEGRI